jgi:DNA/RNA-binding domain of Phe-tRNA-synthetase-like protein
LGDLVQDLEVIVTDAWRDAFPEARVGLLLLDKVVNGPAPRLLQAQTRRLEGELRRRFDGADRATLAELPIIEAYQRHFRGFGQTYHVLRQLESVALKGRAIDSPSTLVLAMFTAELNHLLLTAGHDADALEPPLVLDRSQADDRFVGLGAQDQVVRAGDMLMRDARGIISAVVYGPDQRTRLVDQTRRALFVTYAPPGIGSYHVLNHLDELASLVRLAAPEAEVLLRALYPADG